jgi:hypothetical protein
MTNKFAFDRMAENVTHSNETGNTTVPPNQSHNEPYALHMVVGEAIIMMPIIVGNTLILAAIAKYRPLRTRSHILVASLAVADLLVGLIFIPWDIAFYGFPDLGKDKFLCIYRHSMSIVFTSATLANLLAISVERFIATVFPLLYATRVTKAKMMVVGVATWIWPLVIGYLPLFGWNVWVPGITCGIGIWPKLYTDIAIYSLVAFMWLNVIFYSKVAHTVWQRLKRVNNTNASLEVQKRTRKEINRTKLMLLVFSLFVLCWGPYTSLVVFWVPLKLSLRPEMMTLRRFFVLLGIANSCINWIVYGWKNKDFRKGFAIFFGRKRAADTSNALAFIASSNTPHTGTARTTDTRLDDPKTDIT